MASLLLLVRCARLCSETLAPKVPVNDVMRCLMYLNDYRDRGLARSAFEALPDETGALLARLGFSPAERACPRNLPIARLMQEAASRLT
jgi:hypothetical protein